MTKHWLKDSIGLRLAIIALLTLILLIPAAMIQSLIQDANLDEMAQLMR